MIGIGTPSLHGSSAEGVLPSGIAGGDLHQTNESKPVGESLTGQVEDILDLAGGVSAGRRGVAFSYGETSVPGDAALDPDLAVEQLGQVRDRISLMREILAHARNPEQRSVLGREMRESAAILERTGRQLANGSAASSVTGLSQEFVTLVKGFRQIVQEVEKILADENRVPPPLMRVIKELTSESLAADRRRRVSELA